MTKTDQMKNEQAKTEQEKTEQELKEIIAMKDQDCMTPGFVATFEPEEADMFGAFKEDALSEEDAMESSVDLPEALEAMTTPKEV